MLGRPIADIVNANVFRWVHDDDMLTLRSNFGKSLEQPGVPVKNAYRLKHKRRHMAAHREHRREPPRRPEHPGHHHQLP